MVNKTNIYYGVIGALSALIVGFALSAAGFFSDRRSLWGGFSIVGSIVSFIGVIIIIVVREKYFKKGNGNNKNTTGNNN